jgi:hypothetical protein
VGVDLRLVQNLGDHPGHRGRRIYLTAFYYSVLTITTVGYGDIIPTNTCRLRLNRRKSFPVPAHRCRSAFLHELDQLLLDFVHQPKVGFRDSSDVLRNKQYQILNELGSLGLINDKLSREISNNIEAVFKTDSNMKTEDKIQLTELVEVKHQLIVATAHAADRPDVRRQPAVQQLLP